MQEARSDSDAGRSTSELPSGGSAGVRSAGAVRTGADRAAGMRAESGMGLSDPPDRLADRARHTGPSALGRGRSPSSTPAQADRAGEFLHEEVTFGVGLRGPLRVAEYA